MSPRQRRACSPRCRAALSRQRKAEALAAYVARLEAAVQQLGGDPSTMVPQPGPWRFRVSPPGRRFGWRGQVYASDPETGLIEVSDPEFAFALRRLARRDAIQELGSTEGLDTTEERG